MKEELLHFIWKNKLYYNSNLKTVSGDAVEIINSGILNNNSGPDFINAKIKINDTIWCGNVELHLKSSDWFNHKHNTNVDYDSVILHVVSNYDTDTYNTKNNLIPSLIIHFPENIINHYNSLINSKESIACKTDLSKIDPFTRNMCIDRVGVERIQYKVENNKSILKENINDWVDSFYKLLFKSFGFKVNSEAFISVANILKPSIWIKHKDNLPELESLLFGVAGFLNEDIKNNYYVQLKENFEYFKIKYNLSALDKNVWKFMRLRPNNFPTIRISQLAQLLNKVDIFNFILNDNLSDLLKQFEDVQASEYWDNHYQFGVESNKNKPKTLGKTSISSIIINGIVPFLFSYGESLNKNEFTDKSINLLETLPAEINSITNEWTSINIKPESAFTSQALIHITNEYCTKKECLNCVFGKEILSKYL